MKYFDLIIDTCKLINEHISLNFKEDEIWFISASLEQVNYGRNDMEIIFNYAPEKYEYGKAMILKGVVVKIAYDAKRMYTITDVISFIENEYSHVESDYTIYSVEQSVKKINLFLSLIKEERNNGWEVKFNEYLRKKYSHYNE